MLTILLTKHLMSLFLSLYCVAAKRKKKPFHSYIVRDHHSPREEEKNIYMRDPDVNAKSRSCAKVATLLICMVCRRSYFSMIAILLLRNPQTSVRFIFRL